MVQKKSITYTYLGEIDYQSAWDFQKELLQLRREREIPDVLLLLQHPPTITVGKSGTRDHLLADPEFLQSKGFTVTETDRGGDVTYHGPGQLVAYPILDLSEIRKDIFWYLRQLEQIIMNALVSFGITGNRKQNYTGVWVGEEKIAAIGVKVSSWITLHGIALNVTPDLRHFDLIVPCGVHSKAVTSIARICDEPISVEDVLPHFVEQFGNVFGHCMMPYNHATWPSLTQALSAIVGESQDADFDLQKEFAEDVG